MEGREWKGKSGKGRYIHIVLSAAREIMGHCLLGGVLGVIGGTANVRVRHLVHLLLCLVVGLCDIVSEGRKGGEKRWRYE